MTEYASDYLSRKRSSPASDFASSSTLCRLTTHASQGNPAKWTFHKLIESIRGFEKSLDDEHEVGAKLVTFGTPVTFHLHDVSYCAPDIINLSGKSAQGEELQLIQHVSQLNILLTAMKKLGEEPVRLGFKLQRAIGAEI